MPAWGVEDPVRVRPRISHGGVFELDVYRCGRVVGVVDVYLDEVAGSATRDVRINGRCRRCLNELKSSNRRVQRFGCQCHGLLRHDAHIEVLRGVSGSFVAVFLDCRHGHHTKGDARLHDPCDLAAARTLDDDVRCGGSHRGGRCVVQLEIADGS